MGKFGKELKKEFAKRIEGSSAECAYSNIVNARNAVAHGCDTTMTYDELKRTSGDADSVLAELAAVLDQGTAGHGSA